MDEEEVVNAIKWARDYIEEQESDEYSDDIIVD